MLAGTKPPESTALSVVHGTLDDLDLDWRLGQSATGLDLDERAVLLGGGERLPFDGLVIATGASPKRLPGTDHLDGVHTLRTLDDCLEIRAALDAVAAPGGGRRRRLHRRRGGGDVPRTRDRREPHRGAAGARSSAGSVRRWARWSPTCTATTASTCASASVSC